jgi:hypothetical protein
MAYEEFIKFLKRGGRKESVAEGVVRLVSEYEAFLGEMEVAVGESGTGELDMFLEAVESEPKKSGKKHLWALIYYFDFLGMDELRQTARERRQARISRKLFNLRDFRGVDQEAAAKLAEAGIVNVAQMLEAGATPAARESLAAQTRVKMETILEFVKLSDLARVPGLKGIRARLYHDVGVDCIETLASWDPEELLAELAAFVERTGFEGITPLPKEVRSGVKTAKGLPKVVEFEDQA